MSNIEDAEKVTTSDAYRKSRRKADEYKDDPEKLGSLLDSAQKKAQTKSGKLRAIWDQLQAGFRLIKAYAKGEYREIPWSSMGLLIASVAYFVMPVDLVLDWLPLAGYLDDAALLAWTFQSISGDIDAFLAWESEQTPEQSPQSDSVLDDGNSA